MSGTEEDMWIGERLVQAGVLTDDQRNSVLTIQSDPVNKHIRFGEIAIREGFCNEKQIESIGGFLGELLVEKNLITRQQLEKILQMQRNMREGGLYVPNIGELAAMQDICSKGDIENAILFSRRGKKKDLDLPEESSDW